MGRSKLHEVTFPRVKEYMSDSDKAVTAKDIAQYLNMSLGGVHSVMQLMVAFKMAQKVKRGKVYYVLPGLTEEQIETMLPPRKVAPRTRRRRSRSRHTPVEEGVEEYLVAIRERTGEGPSALSIIGLQPGKDEEAEDGK